MCTSSSARWSSSFAKRRRLRRMTLFLTSFGYKFGIPHDTDIIFDVRFLPNPYFVTELRDKERLGVRSRRVCSWKRRDARVSRSSLRAFGIYLAALRARGKKQSDLGSGLHRRTAPFRGLVEELQKRLGGGKLRVHVKHRDIDK